MGTNFWEGFEAFNLFRLLEKETLEMCSMLKSRKSNYKFGGTKVCNTEEVRKYFVSSKIENEVFSLCVNAIICSLGFRNISWTISLLNMRTMIGFLSWCVLTLQGLFHFIACVLFLSIFFFFFDFFSIFFFFEFYFLLRYWGKFVNN